MPRDDSRNWEALKTKTKADILDFLQNAIFGIPKNTEIHSYFWQKESQELLDRMDKHLSSDVKGKLIEELKANETQINEAKNANEQLKLLDHRETLLEKWIKHDAIYQQIVREQKANDKYYEKHLNN